MTNAPADTLAPASPRAKSVDPSIVSDPALAASLLRTARPKQWVKNLLVFAAPMAAGTLSESTTLRRAGLAFVVFTLASVSTYFVNDALDHEADRRHPKKRRRPIAAGLVSLRLAWLVAAVGLTAALALGFGGLGREFGLLITGYVVMTLTYSVALKHVAVIDLVCVAAGFVLRMIAGGLAAEVIISNWFLTVACFSSLFVVAGKRFAELLEVSRSTATAHASADVIGVGATRAVLGEYTLGFLRATWGMALAVTIAAYCQWAFDRAETVGHLWYQLSAIPWGTGLLRYALLLEQGHGGAPEDVFLSDRVLQVLGLIWLAFFGVGVYAN